MDEFYVKVEFFHAHLIPFLRKKGNLEFNLRDSFVILIRYTTDMFVAHALNMLAPILLLSGHQPIRGVIP